MLDHRYVKPPVKNLREDGRLKSCGLKAGFKGEDLHSFLDKHKIFIRCLVCAGNRRIIVQDDQGLLWLYQEGEECLKQLKGSQEGLLLQCATENLVVALNGHHELHTADLVSEVKLSFSQPLAGLSVSSVSCGLEHVVIVSDTGNVYSYGSGSRGQLGHGELTVDRVTKPTLIDVLEGIKVTTVACGGWHSTAITADGDMYVWGWNESGQLGIPNGKERSITNDQSADRGLQAEELEEERLRKSQKTDSNADEACRSPQGLLEIPLKIIQNIDPVQVQTTPYGLDIADDLKVKKVSCGTRHTCVLFESGILMTCGWNNYGQLCHGDTESRDFLETVQYFVDKDETVVDVKAECWNTAVQTNKV